MMSQPIRRPAPMAAAVPPVATAARKLSDGR